MYPGFIVFDLREGHCICVCAWRSLAPTVDTQVIQVLHSQQREKERETTGTTVLSHLCHSSLLILPLEHLLSQKPAQSRLSAPHITTTYALCTRCTARSFSECTQKDKQTDTQTETLTHTHTEIEMMLHPL